MPRLYDNRPLNTKIVKRSTVYNTHNGLSRTFNNYDRMFSYHSPRTQFIDYDSSRIIDKQRTRGTWRLILTDIMVVYKKTTYNYNTNRTTITFHKINGEELTDMSDETNIRVLRSTFSMNRITQIQNAIGSRRPVPASTPDDLQRALDEIGIDTSRPRESETINPHLIYSYHNGPRDICFKRGTNDTSTRFFGIELEIDASRDMNASNTKRNTLATRLHNILNQGNYNSLVKFENDSSIGQYGFEIITQPMTMKYILENRETLNEAMNQINALNYSSHDSGRCGMHIHVNKNILTEEAIDNLYLIFENFKNEIIAFSRRNQEGMRWCRFISDRGFVPDVYNDQYIKDNKPDGNDHGSAINNGNRNTIEFRIFRGTTKLSTFIANIQFIDNIIDIVTTKDDITGLTWEDIINHNESYTELINYNNKRGIVSRHRLSKRINKIEVVERPVILVRPFQLRLEGDN
ncbi:MAG TPA: hypothetical protein GX708_01690 [Gallicola sp.]|nr:hypothetical protein [Gallicola sp.]